MIIKYTASHNAGGKQKYINIQEFLSHCCCIRYTKGLRPLTTLEEKSDGNITAEQGEKSLEEKLSHSSHPSMILDTAKAEPMREI